MLNSDIALVNDCSKRKKVGKDDDNNDDDDDDKENGELSNWQCVDSQWYFKREVRRFAGNNVMFLETFSKVWKIITRLGYGGNIPSPKTREQILKKIQPSLFDKFKANLGISNWNIIKAQYKSKQGNLIDRDDFKLGKLHLLKHEECLNGLAMKTYESFDKENFHPLRDFFQKISAKLDNGPFMFLLSPYYFLFLLIIGLIFWFYSKSFENDTEFHYKMEYNEMYANGAGDGVGISSDNNAGQSAVLRRGRGRVVEGVV